MTILFSSLAPVKSATGRRFGKGILAARPTYKTGYTASDAAWWAAELAGGENARYDQMAGEAAEMGRLEAGSY